MNGIEYYWNSIPIGKENAATYQTLCNVWGKNNRAVRAILHELSAYDSGDNYVLIRSSKGKGFYRTDDLQIIRAYRKECTNKARSNFAPLKKINRILGKHGDMQMSFNNNMRVVRLSRELKQQEVVNKLHKYDSGIDVALLSKLENSVCLPTPAQLFYLARIYGCAPSELINCESIYEVV